MVAYEVPTKTSAAYGTVNDVLSRSVVVVGVFVAYLATVVTEIYKVEVCSSNIECGIA